MQENGPRRPTLDHQGVEWHPGQLFRHGPRRKGVADKPRERRFARHRHLRRPRHPRPEKRAAGEDEWVLGGEGVDARRAVLVEQPGPQPRPTYKGDLLLYREGLEARLAAGEVDYENSTMIGMHSGYSRVPGPDESSRRPAGLRLEGQGLVQVFLGVDVEEAQVVRVHAIDVVFFYVGDPDLFEKQGDLQVIALQPLLDGLKAALRIYGVKGLGPAVQPRDHDIIVGGDVQHETQQFSVQEGHVAGNHDSVVAPCRREAGEYAAQGPAVRVDVGGGPDPGREVQGLGPRLLSDDHNRLGAYLGEPADHPLDQRFPADLLDSLVPPEPPAIPPASATPLTFAWPSLHSP